MFTTYLIAPHPSLQLFVDQYVLCTSEDEKTELCSNWFASNETSMVFYLGDRPTHLGNDLNYSALQAKNGCLIGLLPGYNGAVQFKGVYKTFYIQFKANGYNKIFFTPGTEFVNKIFYVDEVLGASARNLNDSLQDAETIEQMAKLADGFLLHFLARQKPGFHSPDPITYISNQLSAGSALLSVGAYARKANMSVRSFGRKFTEQTGVSPKLYFRLLRFNNALNTKLKTRNINWTSIAYECGYHDQMHMIKDFRQFANITPSSLFRPHKQVYFAESAASADKRVNIVDEKFVTVQRSTF